MFNNNKKISKLRLEFECSNQEYYTELDAVEVVGVLYDLPNVNEFSHKLKNLANAFCEANLIKPFLNKLESASSTSTQQQQQQQQQDRENEEQTVKEVGENLNRLNMRSMSVPAADSVPKSLVSCSNIVDLPNEILNMILSYCDLKTIFTLKSTCKLFYNICSDEHLYRHIDLQPYWHMANDGLVDQLAQSASKTTMINLSWTKLKSNKSLERQAYIFLFCFES